ncbi:mitochondrial carrier [Jaminaea rosea]|uniref:Mitochondrial carrier n=1 Tax=Jaminaea rosea TaxID=1569628 RepID=A0A316UXW3_9BASI|nr:mitochondrial carrier [Jaminaea rosea]PWN30140.1 mitochondrial carrier [Jaminaea rosea]
MDCADYKRQPSRLGASSSSRATLPSKVAAQPSLYALPAFDAPSHSSPPLNSSPPSPSPSLHRHTTFSGPLAGISAFSVVEPPQTTAGAPTAPRKRMSRAVKDVLFGSVAGMVAKVFEHPFDLIKVRLQTQPFTTPPPGSNQQPRGTLYNGALDAFRSTIRKEGFLGLFRGLSMPILGATMENATLFFTYNAIQGQLRRFNGEVSGGETGDQGGEEESALPMSQLAIAAAGAGAATSLVLTPVELIKCRMQVQMIGAEAQLLAKEVASGSTAGSTVTVEALNAARRSLPGPVALLRQTIQENGIRGLWLGQTGTLLRETGGGVAWFLAFEGACRSFVARRQQQQQVVAGGNKVTKADLSSLELVVAGAAAGVSYNVVLFPADVVKSTMQTEAELAAGSGNAKVAPSGFLTTFQRIWATRGIRGLYAGCGVTCLRSGPSSAIIFLLYSRLEQLADRRGW